MREFMTNGFTIRNANPGLRIILTVFDLFFLLGMVTSFYLARVKMGLEAASVNEYYRGDLDGFRYAMSPLELLEITHLHAFTMGLVYMVLAHVFLLTELAPKIRVWTVGIWGLLFLAKLLLPWAIRYGPPWSAGLFAPLSAVLLTLWIVFQPLYEMWSPRR